MPCEVHEQHTHLGGGPMKMDCLDGPSIVRTDNYEKFGDNSCVRTKLDEWGFNSSFARFYTLISAFES